ncbi:MAG: glycosyl transferase [Oscillospiraceae bacterium]|nr:glycosyl transferase [Oscillospiraceae bacterium]
MSVKSIAKKATQVIPDKLYIQMRFFQRMKRLPDLKNPKTFNEKLQWLKLYDRKPEYTTMVDKYEVKRYIAEQIGEKYVIPTLGVWDRFEDIDFDSLPDQFVLKCTHDSGGLVICRDKSKLDKEAAKKKIEASLKVNYYWQGREWPYKNVKPHVLAEAYMEDENESQGLTDYKFFCFNGEPKLLYISQGLEDHATAQISFFDMDGQKTPFYRSDYRPMDDGFTLPGNFEDMHKIAQILAQRINCPFVRIDLYSIKGKLYFSEITFSPCSGMLPFQPMEWDQKLGDWISLPTDKAEKM